MTSLLDFWPIGRLLARRRLTRHPLVRMASLTAKGVVLMNDPQTMEDFRAVLAKCCDEGLRRMRYMTTGEE